MGWINLRPLTNRVVEILEGTILDDNVILVKARVSVGHIEIASHLLGSSGIIA